ncbi:S-type pyocin domain-containing protein [Pseudomonas sp. R1-18]|uniref:S-type pyocin domain-containing protein n=1 Tax=Pseudomonas sp. R1-18 TaxID=1632772 RepID=UPI003DA7C294
MGDDQFKDDKMSKKQVTLPPTYIGAQPFGNDFNYAGWSLGGGVPAIPQAMLFGSFMWDTLKEWDKKFNAELALVDSNLVQELAAARGGQAEDINTIHGVQRELALRVNISNGKRTVIQQFSQVADQFYGSDPLALTSEQQWNQLLERMKRSRLLQDVHRLAQHSHEAAYKRRYAAEALTRLGQQEAFLRSRLADLQAQAEAAARAAAERTKAEAAARAAAERAQADAAAKAAAEQAQAEAAAQAAAERARAEAAAKAAAEQAQAEAAAKAAAEQAQAEAAAQAAAEQAQAEAAAQAAAEQAQAEAAAQAAAEQAQAEAAAQAAAEQAQAEAAAQAAAEQAQAEAAAEAEAAAKQAQAEAAAQAAVEQAQGEEAAQAAGQRVHTAVEAEWPSSGESFEQIGKSLFQFSGMAGTSGAQLLTTAGRIVAAEGSTIALQAAIRIATGGVAGVAAAAAATAPGLLVGLAALIYPSELGNGELPERYALSLPLTDLGVSSDTEQSTGTIDVPVRLGFKPSDDEETAIIAIPADGVRVSTSVQVIPVTYDAVQNVYTASTPDTPERTLIWTPIVQPGDSSTATPVENPPAPVYEGATLVPVEGRIDTYPDLADVEIDDYIFVFPADSGLPPLYVVFKSPRNMPGVVSGDGQDVSAGWLGLTEGEGAPIPKQIADQMRGRKFSSFSSFRRTFWKLVAADPILSTSFTYLDLERMKKGYAPYVPMDQRVGGRKKFEIHHIHFISNGGAVYDVNNLLIVSPKYHINLHSGVSRD